MLKKLKLTNFRNFTNKEIEFSEGVNVINAPNAKGKTNILEAIFFLATGKSFKARKEEECIKHNVEIARISAYGLEHNALEIVLTKGVDGLPAGRQGWPKKKFLVNGVSKRAIDFSDNIKTVLFGPWDMDLVAGPPAIRRKFLDTVLSQVDREYRRTIGSYEKGIRQRNRLLFRIREENVSRNNLLFWNQLLIKNGNYITEKRQDLIEFINSRWSLITGHYSLEYDSSVISEGRLEQYKNEEIATGMTLVGPHRDDFVFQTLNSKSEILNLATYGSRGEQRMAILWLKLAELSFVEQKTSELPILLLDDIFSELDHHHRKVVLDNIRNHQVIITSADKHHIEGLITDKIINI